jgi:hypothetical protein
LVWDFMILSPSNPPAANDREAPCTLKPVQAKFASAAVTAKWNSLRHIFQPDQRSARSFPFTYDRPTQGTGRGRAIQALRDQYALGQILSRQPKGRYRLHRSRESSSAPRAERIAGAGKQAARGSVGDPERGRNRRNYPALTTGNYYHVQLTPPNHLRYSRKSLSKGRAAHFMTK